MFETHGNHAQSNAGGMTGKMGMRPISTYTGPIFEGPKSLGFDNLKNGDEFWRVKANTR